MSVRVILALLALVFLAMAVVKSWAGTPVTHPQVRTWLMIGVIFGGVSGWLFLR